MAGEMQVTKYTSLSGLDVTLDAETVKKSLTRGNGKVTDQEVAMFIRTCQAKALDPFENGEVYLIKYDDKVPAQLVVGCHAYARRADHFPDYRGLKCGITVIRNDTAVQKEGCCVYKQLGETLIGGWCRVFRERSKGGIEETFVEVSLDEYSTGQSNWKSKPATMIQKVAKAQALRTAFPNEYQGLYTVDELNMSGAFSEEYTVDESTGEVTKIKDETITQEERQELFRAIRSVYDGQVAAEKLKELVMEEGYTSTSNLPKRVYEKILKKIESLQEFEEADFEEIDTGE